MLKLLSPSSLRGTKVNVIDRLLFFLENVPDVPIFVSMLRFRLGFLTDYLI